MNSLVGKIALLGLLVSGVWGGWYFSVQAQEVVVEEAAPSVLIAVPVTPTLSITAPANDFDSVSGTYDFTAEYANGAEISNFDQWEIYEGTCDVSTGAILGTSQDDSSTFVDGTFTASVDTSSLAPGNYCFVVNPVSGDEPDMTAERTFVIDAYYPIYSTYIEGYKWNDVDGDGYWDEGEEGLPGWTITIDNGEENYSTVTDEDGHYSFDVNSGEWTVSEVPQRGWKQTGLQSSYVNETLQESDLVQTSCQFYIYSEVLDKVTVSKVSPYRCDFGNQKVESSVGHSSGTKVGYRKAPKGEVLGASTTTEPVNDNDGTSAPKCGLFLYDYMRAGTVTYAQEVIKLQAFLTGQGFHTPTTGIFDETTTANVRLFQAKYLSDVLKPWGLEEPTGYVYKTTRWKINNMICPGSEEMPILEGTN